jgi:long-chain acyl-CoA synthetase
LTFRAESVSADTDNNTIRRAKTRRDADAPVSASQGIGRKSAMSTAHGAVSAIDRRWLAHYPKAVPQSLDTANSGTLVDMLSDSFRRYESRPAFESFGKRLTFGDIRAVSDAILVWLQAQGFQRGDRIAIMMPNVMAYPAVMFAILRGGYAVVNVNPLYTPRELAHQLNDSGARALFVLENFAHTVEEARSLIKLDRIVVATAGDLLGLKGHIVNFVARKIKKVVKPFTLPGFQHLASILYNGKGETPAPVRVEPQDVAFLQYTGGTTGVAKGATLTHANIAANVLQCDAWITPHLDQGVGTPVMVTALPLYHIFALTCCCIYMMRLGACCLLIANPRDIPGFVKTLKGTRFTMISGVNTLYNALLNADGIREVDFSALQFAVAGGMAMQAPVAKRWKDLTGKPVIEGYGLSETSPVVSVNPLTLAEFSGTIGFPLPATDVVIRDADGQTLPAGTPGELCVRGPQVMAGYWRRPDETAKAMTADGFFRTGDVAIMLDDGQFKIVDRMKDMVLVSGFNVYPNEVEEVIATHPGVMEVAVIGLPDPHSGEAVAAYVVRKDPALTEEALRDHCRESLTAYKVPKSIVFRESLPKTNVGKVLRRALRDEVLARTA